MDFRRKYGDFTKIKEIYALFDQAVKDQNWVCREKCAACCTSNVTVTEMEAQFLIASVSQAQQSAVVKMIRRKFPEKRYQPLLTMNTFVEHCMQGKEVEAEENDPSWGRCPLLKDDKCSVYPFRPFGCRALLSQVDCSKKGYAQVPEQIQALQNLFVQIIEHLDAGAKFGNLSDVLLEVCGAEEAALPPQVIEMQSKALLINREIPVLMIPPEHRGKLMPMVRELMDIVKG